MSCKDHIFISDLLIIGSFQTVRNEGFSITFIRTNKKNPIIQHGKTDELRQFIDQEFLILGKKKIITPNLD